MQWKKMKPSLKTQRLTVTIGMAGTMVSQLKHKNGVIMILTAELVYPNSLSIGVNCLIT